MNAPKSDASTSTEDDIKGRPLCLFYFSHPFAVLSPEPPTMTAPPPHLAHLRAASFFTASSEDYATTTTTSGGLGFDLGAAQVHRSPLLVSVAKARRCTVNLEGGRDSLPSSMVSSEVWFSSGSSARGGWARLPPLRLPTPPNCPLPGTGAGDPWLGRCLYPAKFSLPPIDVSAATATAAAAGPRLSDVSSVEWAAAGTGSGGGGGGRRRGRRRAGVAKRRGRGARQLSGTRRTLACLMRRTVWDKCL